MPVVLYPNTSINSNFTNPVSCDKLIIYINSEFYKGWADYAQKLTSTTVMLDHRNQTAIIEMDTVPPVGTFPLKHSFKIGRLNQSNSEPIYNFYFYLEDIKKDASNLNAVEINIDTISGTKKLNYNIKKTKAEITYTDASVSPTKKEIWTGVNSFKVNVDPKNKKNANTTLDLVTDAYMMKYTSSTPDFSWDEAGTTTMIPNLIISKTTNNTQSINNVTQHYMKLIGQDGAFVVNWEQKNNKKIDESKSAYTVYYDSGPGILTYLHITRNELNTTIDQ